MGEGQGENGGGLLEDFNPQVKSVLGPTSYVLGLASCLTSYEDRS